MRLGITSSARCGECLKRINKLKIPPHVSYGLWSVFLNVRNRRISVVQISEVYGEKTRRAIQRLENGRDFRKTASQACLAAVLFSSTTIHTANGTQPLLMDFGWERLDYPPLQPTRLAPSDFRLFFTWNHCSAAGTSTKMTRWKKLLTHTAVYTRSRKCRIPFSLQVKYVDLKVADTCRRRSTFYI